jgi:uncharacterized RDD family membrane protein YckC
VNQPHDPYQTPASTIEDLLAELIELRPAGKWRRFGTYVIDLVCCQFLVFAFFVVVLVAYGEPALDAFAGWREYALVFAIFTVYYLFFEGLLARTPGKFACGTVVVDESGNRPSFGQVVGRTFARFIPFEAFSVLFSDDDSVAGWHDTLSRTRVVLAAGRG